MVDEKQVSAQRLMDAVSALHSIGRDIGATLDMRGLLRRIIQQAAELLDAEAGCGISLYDASQDALVLSEGVGQALRHIGTVTRRGEGVVGHVLASGQSIAVEDYQSWEGRSPQYANTDYDAVLGVPLRWQDEIVGVLSLVDSRPTRKFSDEDIRVAEMFAAQAAVAIGNIRLFEATRRRLDQLDRLRSIALELLSSTDIHSILRLIAGAALEHTGAQDVHLYLYDQTQQSLSFGASLWADGTEDREYAPPRPGGITMTVARTGERLVITDPHNHPLYSSQPDWDPLEAMISVPLLWGGEVLGVFNVAFQHKVVIDQDLLHFLDTLAAQAAVAIHNARMFEGAHRRAEEFQRLRSVAVEVLSATDISAILLRIAQEGVEYAHAQDVRIYLYDQASDRLTFGTSLVDPVGKSWHEARPPRPNGLTATVARTGERILVTDPRNHPLFGPVMDDWRWDFHTLVGVPLKRGDEVIGVFNVVFAKAVSEDTLRFLDLLAAQAALAIQNARLFAAVERRAEEYSRLRAVALDLLSSPNVRQTMRTIARAAVDVAQASEVHIYMYEASANLLTLSTSLRRDTGEFDQLIYQPRPDGLTATVVRTGERIVITDPRHHPLFAERMDGNPWDFESVVGVPLKQGAAVVGVMNVLFEDRVSENVLHYLDLLAAQAVIALQSVHMYEAERRASARSEAILKAALSLSGKLSLEDLLRDILTEIAQVVPYVSGSIMILEGGSPAIVALAGYDQETGTSEIRLASERLKDSPILQQMIRTHESVVIEDVRADPRWVMFPHTAHIRGWIGIPLIARGEMIGALSLDSDRTGAFSAEEVEMARGLAAHVAVALENARLFDRIQDALAQLEALFKAGQKLIAAREPEEMLAAIAEPALSAGAHQAWLLYVDHLDEQGQPEWVIPVATLTQDASSESPADRGRYRLTDYPITRVTLSEPLEVRLIPDIEAVKSVDPRTYQIVEEAGICAAASVPLVVRGALIGLVFMTWREPHAFTEQEEQFFRVVGPQLTAMVENHRLLEKTRSAEERFRDIALGTSDWLWETDVEGIITYCSERVVDSLGYTAREITGKRLHEIIAPEDTPRIREIIQNQQQRRDAVQDLQHWSLHRDGHRVRLSTSIAPIVDSRPAERGARQGRVLGWRGVSRDVTDQYSAEQRERLAYEVGQQMTAVLSLGDLTSAIVNQVQQAFGYYHVHLFLLEDHTGTLRVREGTGKAGEILKEQEFGVPLDAHPSLVARAARTRRPVISNDARHDYDHLPNPYLPETRSEAAFPLLRGDRLLGVLDVQAAEPGRFSVAELRTLENVSAHASIAIENARLYEAERAARARADALLEASRALSSTLSLQEVLESILKQCSQVLPYMSGSILIYEEGTPIEVALDGYVESPDEFKERVLREFKGGRLLNHIIRTQEPVTVNDVEDQPDWWVPVVGRQNVRAWMGLPLIVRHQVIGILMLNSDQAGAYTPEHAIIAQGLAAHASIAIENARLYQARERQAAHLEDLVADRTIEVVRERERLKAIVESAGEGIIFTGPTGEIEFVNPAWERITGFRALDVLGRHTTMVFDSVAVSTLAQMISVLDTGKSWQGEMHARRPDGSEYDAAVTVAPVFEADGSIAHVVGVFRDITGQKEVDRMRKKFVANVSHELRTPITSIKLFHTLLQSGPAERREDYLRTMAGEIARLERLVEDLLDISRLDRGVLSLEVGPVDLNEVVEEVMRVHTPRAEGRGLSVELALYEGLPKILGDRQRLAQVITNLITNAINYSSPGDRIGVRTALTSQAGQAVITLAVSDTGVGIAGQDLPFVFNRFFRAETARVEGIPGTGLGLSIVKEIVEMHNGIIRAESTLGEGSTFTVMLPVEQFASEDEDG